MCGLGVRKIFYFFHKICMKLTCDERGTCASVDPDFLSLVYDDDPGSPFFLGNFYMMRNLFGATKFMFVGECYDSEKVPAALRC